MLCAWRLRWETINIGPGWFYVILYIFCEISELHLPVFTDIDECNSSPCQNNGTCENLVAAFNCKCIPGFIGENCESSELLGIRSCFVDTKKKGSR